MNGVKISGGLCNQMFQYAFIAGTGRLFFLEKEGAPIELYKYFKIKKNIFYFIDRVFFDHGGCKLFFSHYLRKTFYAVIKKLFISKTVSVSNTDKPVIQHTKPNGVLFEGYFQSPLYFMDNINLVFKLFELKGSVTRAYNYSYNFLNQKSRKVAVHIRRTDYVSLAHLNLGGADLSIPLSYYHEMIKKIHDDNNYYIFISDEPDIISAEFAYINNKYVSKDTAIVDFQHMLHADICLIANSTFSWWAAYLNKNPGKVVYCPEKFLGFRTTEEYPVNIYPGDWIQIPVSTQIKQ